MARARRAQGRPKKPCPVRLRKPTRKVAAFDSHDELLESARQMIEARRRATAISQDIEEGDLDEAMNLERRWTRLWHTRFERSESLLLCGRCLGAALTRTEREMVVVLLLAHLGLSPQPVSHVGEVPDALGIDGPGVLAALRSLSEEGRLLGRGFMSYQSPDDDIGDRALIIDPALVDAVLYEGKSASRGWPVKTEEEMRAYLERLIHAFARRSDELLCVGRRGEPGDFFKWSRRVDHHLQQLEDTLNRATAYYRVCAKAPDALTLREAIDRQYTVTPYYGVPRMSTSQNHAKVCEIIFPGRRS